VDSFHSTRDPVFTNFTNCVPPPGFPGTAYAGEKGFCYRVLSGEEALCAKLRQYNWQPEMACTGHRGNHFGYAQPEFLRCYVLPLLLSE
jgi:hypothetical protein